MSKIGNNPIQVPATVQVKIEKNQITVKGRDGEMSLQVPRIIQFKLDGNKLMVRRLNDEKKSRSVHGLFRQLIFNAVKGVETPWQRKLEVVGTGYNVKMQGDDLVFKLGFSHPVVYKKNPKLKYQTEGNNKVAISGIDKQLVGQVAYLIKMIKPPDIYKGKGIRYEGERIKLKPGKKVKASSGTAA